MALPDKCGGSIQPQDCRMTRGCTNDQGVIGALEQAYERQGRPSEPVMHHSDRGSQYASHDYQQKLREYGMTGSMSRKGNCFDNACVESFHSIIKRELIYLEKFKTRKEAIKRIFEYIEGWYNRERIHSSLTFLSPVEFERRYFQSLHVKAS